MEGRSKSFLVAFLSPLHSRWINFYTITATIYISQMGRQTARETCSQLSKQPTIDTAEFASRLFPHKYLQYVEQMTRIQCEPSWYSVYDMMIFTVDHLDGWRWTFSRHQHSSSEQIPIIWNWRRSGTHDKLLCALHASLNGFEGDPQMAKVMQHLDNMFLKRHSPKTFKFSRYAEQKDHVIRNHIQLITQCSLKSFIQSPTKEREKEEELWANTRNAFNISCSLKMRFLEIFSQCRLAVIMGPSEYQQCNNMKCPRSGENPGIVSVPSVRSVCSGGGGA